MASTDQAGNGQVGNGQVTAAVGDLVAGRNAVTAAGLLGQGQEDAAVQLLGSANSFMENALDSQSIWSHQLPGMPVEDAASTRAGTPAIGNRATELDVVSRKMEELQASTMNKLVETADDILKGGRKRICFLTNLQATVLSQSQQKIENFIEHLGIPKPQLLIYLLPSWGGVSSINLYQQVGLQALLDTPLAGLGRGVSFKDELEAFTAEEKLEVFMRKVLIPLAEQNNALVIVGGIKGVCVLSTTFNKMVNLEQKRWGGKRPFTIMSVCNFLAPLYLNDSDPSAFWPYLKSCSDNWKESDLNDKLKNIWTAPDNISDDAQWKGGDLDPTPNVFLVVDGISKDNGKEEIDFVPMGKLITQVVSYQQARTPILGVKTYQSMKGDYALGDLKTALDVMTIGCPILFLDVHQPEVMTGTMLAVTIIEGKGIHKSALKMKSLKPRRKLCNCSRRQDYSADSYVVCKIKHKGKTRFQTKVKKDTSCPQWGQTFLFTDYSKKDDSMSLQVFDDDRGASNEELGHILVSPEQIQKMNGKPDWLKLKLDKSRAGQVLVKFDILNWNDPDEDEDEEPVTNRDQMIDKALKEHMKRCDVQMRKAQKQIEIKVTRDESRTYDGETSMDNNFRSRRVKAETIQEKQVEAQLGLSLAALPNALRIRWVQKEVLRNVLASGEPDIVQPPDRITAVNHKHGTSEELIKMILDNKESVLTIQRDCRTPYFLDVCVIAHFYHIFYGDKETFEKKSEDDEMSSTRVKWAVATAKKSRDICPLHQAIDQKRKDQTAGDLLEDVNWLYPTTERIQQVLTLIIERFFQDCWELRVDHQEAEATGCCGKPGHTNCRTSRQHYHEEIQDWRQYAETFLRPPSKDTQNFYALSCSEHSDIEGGKKLVRCLTKRDRLPAGNSLEGLCTLRECWKEVDECTYQGTQYKRIAKVLFSLYLFLQITIVFATVFRGYYGTGSRRLSSAMTPLEPEECGYLSRKLARTCSGTVDQYGLNTLMGVPDLEELEGGDSELSAPRRLTNSSTSAQNSWEDLFAYDFCETLGCDTPSIIDHCIFCLSLISMSVLSFTLFLNPVQRWRQLRSSACSLESIVWQFRCRCQEFSMPGATDSGADPNYALAEALAEWRKDLVRGSDLLATSLNRKYERGERVYMHYQYEGEVRPDKPGDDEPVPGRKERGDEDKKYRNDHQSPTEPEAYVQMRLIAMMRWYQYRLPLNSRRRTRFTIITLCCTVLSSLVAYVNEDISVALLSSFAATIAAWAEFVDVGRKIERYSGAIRSLKATLSWWDSLNEVGQASTVNINRLVAETETIITNEHRAWKSTASDKDKKAKGKDDAQEIKEK